MLSNRSKENNDLESSGTQIRRFWLSNTLFVSTPQSNVPATPAGGPPRGDSKRSSRDSNPGGGNSSHLGADKLSVLNSERNELESSRGANSYARSKSKNSQYTATEVIVLPPTQVKVTDTRLQSPKREKRFAPSALTLRKKSPGRRGRTGS